jgi:bacteriorhodopsin
MMTLPRMRRYVEAVNNTRLLTVVQFVCVTVWLVGMIGTFLSDGQAKWVWLALWTLAFIVFFVSFWRTMWLRSDPARRERGDAG